jgi:hypothetical protein
MNNDKRCAGGDGSAGAGERERFKAWVSASGRAHLLEREVPHGWYIDLNVTAWWTAWQARAAIDKGDTHAGGDDAHVTADPVTGEWRSAGCAEGGKSEAVAEVVNKYGDPDAFAERDLVIQEEVLKTLPIGTKLYAAPIAPHSKSYGSGMIDAIEDFAPVPAPREAVAFYDGRSKEPCLLWAFDGYKPAPHDVVLVTAPIAPRSKSYGSGMIDAIEDFSPVPAPRADADTAGAFPVSKEIIEAIQSYGDLRADRASNTADKIGEVILMIRDALATAGASNERADAEDKPVEVWHGERKVTIYPDFVLRIWGANIETEMSEAPRTIQSVQDAMTWLFERADAEKDAALMRIAHELRTYNPAADEYKGVHIHNGWASKIEDLLAAADREALIDRVTLEVKEARS